VFSVIAFLISFGGIIMEERPIPVLLNGKPFGNVVKINGVLAMSVHDFIKGAGALTLEPAFRLQGSQLSAVAPGMDRAGKGKEKWQPNALFGVRKAGVISSHVFMSNGKAFIPFADVVIALGIANSTGPVTSRSSEPINLNVAVNGDGIVGVQH
jgi:hypothetical protein